MNDKVQCPFCAEDILRAAKKCKHCGEWLLPPTERLKQVSHPEDEPVELSLAAKQDFAGVFTPLFGANEIDPGRDQFLKRIEHKNVNPSRWSAPGLIALLIFVAIGGAIGKECGVATMDYARSLPKSPFDRSLILFADATAKIKPFGTGTIPKENRQEIQDIIARGLEVATSVTDSELSQLHPDLISAYRNGLVAMWSHTYDAIQSVDYPEQRSKHSALALQASQRWTEFVRRNPNLAIPH